MNTEIFNEGELLPVAEAQPEQKLGEVATSPTDSPENESSQQAVEKTASSVPQVQAAPVVVRPRGHRTPRWPAPRLSAEQRERLRLERGLDCPRRESPRLMRDREMNRDCLTQMSLYRSRPEVLANALLDMGITESGDGVPDKHFR